MPREIIITTWRVSWLSFAWKMARHTAKQSYSVSIGKGGYANGEYCLGFLAVPQVPIIMLNEFSLSFAISILRWRDKTDEHGLDSALVSLADHIFDRFNYAMNRQATQEQVIVIKISALLIAIKANHGMNVRVATDIATQACAEFKVLPYELASMEMEIRQTLNGHVNAPTVHVFLNAYTPLMTNSSNYILDIARFQIDSAILIPLIMVNYNPSTIAFAALMRADDVVYRVMMRPDFRNDEDDADDDDDDDNWLNRGDYDGLMDDLGLDQAVVLEAAFALENEIPNALISLYMDSVDLIGVPPGPNARIIREESPTTVPGSPISVMR